MKDQNLSTNSWSLLVQYFTIRSILYNNFLLLLVVMIVVHGLVTVAVCMLMT